MEAKTAAMKLQGEEKQGLWKGTGVYEEIRKEECMEGPWLSQHLAFGLTANRLRKNTIFTLA